METGFGSVESELELLQCIDEPQAHGLFLHLTVNDNLPIFQYDIDVDRALKEGNET